MFIEEQFILLSIGLAFIAVRMVIRWRQVGISGWQLDDYLMPVTGIVFTLETVAAYLVGAEFQGLTNSYMSDEERATIDPDSEEYFNRQWGSKIQVIGWSFYVFILWAIKFCFASFYSRLTSGLTHLQIRVQIAYVLLGVTYVAVALTLLLSCQPMHKFWQINPDPGATCRPTNSPVYVLVVVIPNVLTDFYLLSIPLPLLWRVKISLRRRITLMLLFSGALFVIMAGTIRAIVISKSGPEGAVSGSSWACRETFVAVIVANLPIIQPKLRTSAHKLKHSRLINHIYPFTGGDRHLESHDRDGDSERNYKKGVEHDQRLNSSPTLADSAGEKLVSVKEDDRNSHMTKIGSVSSEGIVVQEQVSVLTTDAVDKSDFDLLNSTTGAYGNQTSVKAT